MGQCQRIAEALNNGEIALAQIHGLYIPIKELDERQLRGVALARLGKAGFNPDEPRIPAGEPGGGEWTTGDGSAVDAAAPVSGLRSLDEPAPPPSRPPVGGRFPAPSGAHANPLFHPAQAEEDENGRRGGLLNDFIDPLREFRRERYEWLRAQLQNLEPGNRALETLTGPDYSPTQADIDELEAALRDAQGRAGEPPSTAWELGWGARGVELERERLAGERTLPSNTPTIDGFSHNVALSIKSIDLNAPWYGNPANLSRLIDRYVDKLWAFDGMNWGRVKIPEEEIAGKVLDIVVPKNSGTPAQRQAITVSIARASKLGIHVFISAY